MLDRRKQIADLIDSFRAVHKALFKIAPSFLSEHSMTYTQMVILSLVKGNEGLSVKELAGTLGITSSAATQQVDTLVKRGYLIREQSDADRRFVKIRLSGEMDKQVDIFQARFVQQFISFFNELSDEELALYCELNGRIANQMLRR